MNYYTFKNFPKLDIKTFYQDNFYHECTCNLHLTNTLMVKFIWGFKDQGGWRNNSESARYWFER